MYCNKVIELKYNGMADSLMYEDEATRAGFHCYTNVMRVTVKRVNLPKS